MKLIDDHFEEVILVALMAIMTALIGGQIFMRYVMQASLSWSEELARYCFIWMAYISVSYAVKKDVHISTTAFVTMLPPRGIVMARILSHLIFAGFAFLVVYEGIALVEKLFGFGQRSSSLGLLMGYVYLAPVVGFALVLFRLAQRILIELSALKTEGLQ
ncbi:C4-dicarboxylate ABC transporter [Salipiger aestuarii]|uniref:TRAP transporter small permease protein n=1 Tax=Salipiger aestuarii TaxID=568098 RepID=A0A327XRD3_9RHOB|nr:TRAP transporter small permease [Salipiger aestuarii]EIE48666.1 Tripartite ATP-independent periplasmic transporter DctQ component [Citreicella sp. 357]KAA8604796.1 C4-dicarboxylate ABC transporter [Salipiger aestuarii]KAA8606529.1 C4-dicarboxylate ABC transporter [Salipiger aestuarii]KAB2532914.1 C4-dicarboxylate ABC transporter [Salipiger aestuarii]RAK11270.1 TRAP-type C4-dicarboxylate transport system permease small subunit [Salipiger aestuarii]